MKLDFKTWLRKERLKKGYSQQDLADKAGVAMFTISNYERGFTKPRIDKLKKICLALDVEITKVTKYLED